MSQLVTRCPHCSTSFHVSEQQLRAAHGAVRCGSCLQVFRADENILFADSEVDSQKELEALLEDDDFLIHDDILLDDEESAAPPTVPASAATDSPGNDESSADEDQPLIGDAFGETQWRDLDAGASPGEEAEEPETEAVLREEDEEEPDSSPWEASPGSSPGELDAAGDPWAGYREPPTDPAEADDHSDRLVPGDDRPERERLLSSIEPAPLEVSWAPQQQRRVPGWLWGLLAVLLSLALVLQLGIYRFDSLARQQPWRTVYTWACPALGCQLPELRDLQAIRTSNLVVRSHPEIAGALVVDAVLLNTADFDQPFPDLLLRFSNLKNQPVASRRFAPREYLQGELAGRREMPSGSPVHIAIEIEDPGREAINYELLTAN
ncbi:DUF3426 domain-containing protein [Microbulbifer sp. JSM ZJ756]|uniref:DUF3426 domain-containing protein n=1 Tax=Microbulbifer sp. JSM ZJ756 TaxID=3376191 RepID=UPI00379BABA8